jgi:nucleoside-diphosphate-sugar epimerase
VMVDNLYGYGPGAGILTEETPERAADPKGRTRRLMTERLLSAHRNGALRVAIGRASDYFGPHADNSAITALAITPAVEGKPIRWMAGLDAPHSCAYLPDVGRAYVILGTSPEADGRVWHLPHPRPVTGRQFLDLVNGSLPQASKTGVVSTAMLRLAAPFHRISRESLGIAYQWAEPFVVDDSAFHGVFGPFPSTPIERAVEHTVAWYLGPENRLPRPSRRG